jgi:hypothetical protein
MEFGEGFVNEEGVVYNPNQGEEALDPNNINYDADGNVESIYDPESGKTFRNKEEEPPTETPEEVEARIAAGNETEEEKAARILAESETPEEKEARLKAETPPEYKNSADYVLKLSGYENESVELESGVKKITDLTSEEQISIITQEYENIRDNQETVIAETKTKAEEGFFNNEGEKEIITFLREKGDPVELAKYILENSPSLVADMSDEDVIKKQLRDDYPEYTNEEIDDEIELLKNANRLERRAGVVRSKYKDKEVDISNLNQKLNFKSAETKAADLKVHQNDMDKFIDYANEEKTIAGIALSDEIRDYLVSGVVTENPEEKTEWQKELNDPKKQMRLRFLDTYFEKIIETIQKSSFAKGKSVGDNIVKKFRNVPLTLKGENKKQEKVKQPKTVDELDVDHMLEVAEKTF